jgi:hypothetical protein
MYSNECLARSMPEAREKANFLKRRGFAVDISKATDKDRLSIAVGNDIMKETGGKARLIKNPKFVLKARKLKHLLY